ncbi:MAG: hypothetical protein MUP21_08650 [Dehalococcoidia bacterium]|nr:hypothetical protein [Dehalococcoidia bacterium]
MSNRTALLIHLLLAAIFMTWAAGCSNEEATPTPAPTHIPTSQHTATATPPPILTPTPGITPAPTWTSAPIGSAVHITDAVFNECELQFLNENKKVTSANAYQSTDNKTVFLDFSPNWDVPIADARILGEEFIRLVKSRVDNPPGIDIGAGKYEYVTQFTHPNGLQTIQGVKCAQCVTLQWQ